MGIEELEGETEDPNGTGHKHPCSSSKGEGRIVYDNGSSSHTG